MYIERVPNRNSPPAVLLRESYREGDKVRKRTLANLSKLPDPVIDNLKIALKGGTAIENLPSSFTVIRSLPHGHVAATLSTLRKLNLHNLIAPENSQKRGLVEAMIVARILEPRSKLATARGLNAQTCSSSLSQILGFEGNTQNTATLTAQIQKVRHRFGLRQVVWVGDRGMITTTRIVEDFKSEEGIDWITALRASQIRKLVEQDAVQLSLFDERTRVEFSSDDYPGERLIACRNPLLAQEKTHLREILLSKTARELDQIVAATQRQRRPLTGADKIGLRVGKVLNQRVVESRTSFSQL
jgi:hypothetical protein